jgi:enoyl-CoA hydratase
MPDPVQVEDADGVLTITINRPEARNAINAAVAQGVADALDQLDARADLTVGIITGAGGTFSAGMDLKAFLRGERPGLPGRGLAGICEAPPRKPMIAAVEGWALAGGFEVALACDLIVASSTARFGIPEVKRGLVAAAGGLLRLPRRVPPHVAMEMALTGDPISAEDGYRLGLVNRLTEPGGALAGARELAARITPNGPLAIAVSKRIITESVDWPTDEAFARQAPWIADIMSSADAREGAVAFAEKRAPVWTGR